MAKVLGDALQELFERKGIDINSPVNKKLINVQKAHKQLNIAKDRVTIGFECLNSEFEKDVFETEYKIITRNLDRVIKGVEKMEKKIGKIRDEKLKMKNGKETECSR